MSYLGRGAAAIAASLVVALLAAAPLSAAETRVAPNVVVVADPAAATTTVWMIVRAGCRDEPQGHCHGLSHYLEHLMFLGRGALAEALAPWLAEHYSFDEWLTRRDALAHPDRVAAGSLSPTQ